MKKKVSIVVPIYNMGNKIEVCVRALLSQSYQNYEIILVDDGSTDNTLEHCLNLANIDSRIRVFHTENRGSGPARNYGIKKATGDYIYFPDADDIISNNAIEILVKVMEKSNVDLIVFGYKNVIQNGENIKIKKYQEMLKNGEDIRKNYSDYMTTESKFGIQGAPWNKFFKLELINKYNILYPNLRRHQDEGFIGRYMCYVKQVYFIEDVLYTYFTNDLKKEWDKYPIDYIDAVKGLHEERKKNILQWNLEDTLTHNLVMKEYICGIIKSLELSFSPKFKFNVKNRMKWLKNIICDTKIEKLGRISNLGVYQKLVLYFIKTHNYTLIYFILFIKVQLEKKHLIDFIKTNIY